MTTTIHDPARGEGSPGDLRLSFVVDRTPADVFATIDDVRGWWTGTITGPTDRLGAEFTYEHENIHRSTQRVVEHVPDRRIVWLVTAARLTFATPPDEWVGTRAVFDLEPVEGGTEVRFTHAGLGPELECYDSCSAGWRFFVGGTLPARLRGGG